MLPPLGPPTESQWPPDVPGSGAASKRKIPRWGKWLVGSSFVVIVVVVAGSVIRVPYDTFSPGGTLNLEKRVSVKGAKTFPNEGDLMMLFVRQRSHVDLWHLLQAKLDGDIDIAKQEDVNGGRTQQQANQQDVCDMSQSQDTARVAALTALGYRVPVIPGLSVDALADGYPAIKVLRPCDQILAVDGHDLKQATDLSKVVRAQRVGSTVTLRISRGGREQTVKVAVAALPAPAKTHIIGVTLGYRFKVPLQIDIDTNDISGPSAGLAMTLAIIDTLSPGELTGGKRVAVTGTIDPEGRVGEIGALKQKAVAVRHADAQIFIVPACADDPGKAACLADIAIVKRHVGRNVDVEPVSTLDQALKVLRDAGGAPITRVANSTLSTDPH
jgi:Lon-like protease